MTRLVHPACFFLLLTMVSVRAAESQAAPNVQGAPSYQGFHLPTVGGTLSYSATLSGSATKGYYGGGTAGFTSISGNLALLSASKRHPFSMVYSGGYFANLTGDAPSSVFQNLALSQVLTAGRWNFTVADSVSYLPQTATTGISGVAGVGDAGTTPVDVGTGTSLGILTYDQSRVSNTVIGSAQRRLTPSTSFTGSATYSIARFLNSAPSSSALNTDQYGGGLSLNHRLDARSNVGASYNYFHIVYPGNSISPTQPIPGRASSISSNAVTADYSRLLNRKASFFISAGPQWTNIPATDVSPSRTSLNATVGTGLTYTARAASLSLNYSRGTNAGSGVIGGATSDSVVASANRRLTRVWNGSTSFGYSRSSSLLAVASNKYVFNSLSATGQINRSIGRQLSAYGSYTAQHQSTAANTANASTTTAYSGLSQTIAAGLTYSPGVIGRSRR